MINIILTLIGVALFAFSFLAISLPAFTYMETTVKDMFAGGVIDAVALIYVLGGLFPDIVPFVFVFYSMCAGFLMISVAFVLKFIFKPVERFFEKVIKFY